MSGLVKPHGSDVLKPRLLEGRALTDELKRAQNLPRVVMQSRETGDLIMLGIGGFTPLEGFMNKADWRSVCDTMHTADGLFWPIPVTLSVAEAEASALKEGADIALIDGETDEIMGTMTVTEKYTIDKAHECQQVFKTTDSAHPGVKMVMDQGEVNLAGPVNVLSQGEFPKRYGDVYMTPAQTRALFEQKGWSTVAAFQTRNPMHRSHEYLAKIASPAIPSTCATRDRARPCCTRCSDRITVVRISSSVATMPVLATTMGRLTRTIYLTKYPLEPWRQCL